MAVPECSLSGQAFAVALMQSRFKSLNFKVLANGIFLIVLNVLLGHNNSQRPSIRKALLTCFFVQILFNESVAVIHYATDVKEPIF